MKTCFTTKRNITFYIKEIYDHCIMFEDMIQNY